MENKKFTIHQNTTIDNINLDDIVISNDGCQCNGGVLLDGLYKNCNNSNVNTSSSIDIQEWDSPDAVPLSNDERQLCEVWSRVMGYYRPTSSYNVGKKSEYDDRKCFTEPSFLKDKCGDCITRAA